MTTYPIKVSSLSLDHKNGTKSYHIYVIESVNGGQSVFVNRWGKTGQFGELQTKEFGSPGEAWKEFTSKEQTKTRNGYYPKTGSKASIAQNADELKGALGLSLFNKIGKKALQHLDPSIDTTGMRDAEPPKTDDGELKHVRDTTRKADVSEQLAAQQRSELEKAYADNPMFGRF